MDARKNFLESANVSVPSLEKITFLQKVKFERMSYDLSFLEAAIRIGRFAHRDDKRRDGSDYFESHNMQMMQAPEIYPELGIKSLTDYQKALIALHDVFEKYIDNPTSDKVSLKDILDTLQEPKLEKSLTLLTKYNGQPYLQYFLPICQDGNEDELIVKIIDNYSNKMSNPKPERAKLYGITIPYGLARLSGEIEEGYDPQLFAAQNGLYVGDIFLKHGSYKLPYTHNSMEVKSLQ